MMVLGSHSCAGFLSAMLQAGFAIAYDLQNCVSAGSVCLTPSKTAQNLPEMLAVVPVESLLPCWDWAGLLAALALS